MRYGDVILDKKKEKPNTPARDALFLEINEILEKCALINECEWCTQLRRCERIQARLAALSAQARLNACTMQVYISRLSRVMPGSLVIVMVVFALGVSNHYAGCADRLIAF